MRVHLRLAVLVALSASIVSGCTNPLMPVSGPESWDIRNERTDTLPYAQVRVTPEVLGVLATNAPRLGKMWRDKRAPAEIRFGIGDVVSVTIFEAAAGGLFIPSEAGVRPGNFITLPNQNVDTDGNISVPYAGPIRARGRTPQQVQQDIVNALKNRAIEPQVVVALVDQRTSLISVLGDVNTPARFPASAAGEHILDAITRAGGPKSQGYDEWVMLDRQGRREIVPFGALVYEPSNNIYIHPYDTVYLYREPQTFDAFGASGQQGHFPFDAWRISMAEAIGKAAGLNDTLADPQAVFLYRGETREIAQALGVDVSQFEGPIIPVVYNLNFRDPAGYFLATKFQMRNKDVIYTANAFGVESAKAMQYFRLMVATVNDPIVAATNVYALKASANGNVVVGVSTGGGTFVSDVRLKHDIVKLARLENGLDLYRYRYRWSDQVYVGVMAQEVEKVAPQAVVHGRDGYLRVDYGRLGMSLMTWEEWLASKADKPAH
jgi:polysaccharide export outer membrane protein